MSRESKTLKQSSSWLNSGNSLIQHLMKNTFSRFLILPGSAEAQVIRCGIIKCLLIAYFIGNIFCQRIYQNPFTISHVSKLWQAKGATFFLKHGVKSH